MPHACADIPLWHSPHINTRFEPLFHAHENNFRSVLAELSLEKPVMESARSWNHHTKIVNISDRETVIENIFLKPLA
jgi:hypothetical protein